MFNLKKLFRDIFPIRTGGWIDGKWVPDGGWIDCGSHLRRMGWSGEWEYRAKDSDKPQEHSTK